MSDLKLIRPHNVDVTRSRTAFRHKPWSGRSQSMSHRMFCGAPPPAWRWPDSVRHWAGAAAPPSPLRAAPPRPSCVESGPSSSALPHLSEWLTAQVWRDKKRKRESVMILYSHTQETLETKHQWRMKFLNEQVVWKRENKWEQTGCCCLHNYVQTKNHNR